ncbi:MAG: ATP-binding protein [Chloroflexota bacterium]|nr:ATP-binding protein [Chloroflexota bacterium]
MMRSLFWKGMLAFLSVILVAVGTVALLSGWITEVEFRRYTLAQEGRWERQIAELAAYYAGHGSWEGIQDTLLSAQGQEAGQQGRGRGGGSGGAGAVTLDFRLVDPEGRIVGDSGGFPSGAVSREELASALPIKVQDQIVGYLLPSSSYSSSATVQTSILDVEQAQFLARVRAALWVAAAAATVVALTVGGLLFRSIIAPLRSLTAASQTIAEGDLSARAPVQGRDEIAQLADAFNQMAGSLSQAEEARQNQTADIAHELRTPLTVIQGTLEAMLDGVYSADQENLLAALAQTRTLSRLVDDLRLLALADAGRLRLHTAPLNLSPFLRQIVEAHQPQALERGVSLVLETLPSLLLVEADRDRLAQVMGNLLGNALRYVPQGGHIAVRAMEQNQEIVVAVADDGPGIPSEDLPHLFERFWRGDHTRRQATGGSGLGLTIAHSIVKAHGGHMWAESVESEGVASLPFHRGSTFAFALPVSIEA